MTRPVSPTGTNAAPGRQLTDQGRERRQQLLDCAAVLFAERGYASTRIADICTAAGVAKGLFYWYFENKEALFADLVRVMRQRLRRAQAEAIDPHADSLTQLRQGTEASVRFMATHMAFFALLEHEGGAPAFAALLGEGREVHTSDTALLIAAAQRSGEIPDGDDPQLLALGVVGAVAQFCHYQRIGLVKLGVDDLAALVGRWVAGGLGATPLRLPQVSSSRARPTTE
jgi:AcrR family transcriptional regulator